MRRARDHGFTFVELMVVLFILSALAFFTLPYFAAPGGKGPQDDGGHQALASLMASLKLRAVKEGRNYQLHLDQTSGRAWVTVDAPGPGEAPGKPDPDNEEEAAIPALEGLPVRGAAVFNQADPDPADTVIRFFSRGYSDAALVHLAGQGQEVTLKLHPFLPEPETLPGREAFHDCD